MRSMTILAAGLAMVLSVGSATHRADAQTTRGADALAQTTRSFTPIEKAACGPHWGPFCGPWHHRVCGPYRCWCARCW